jgi:hypothetical protein
MLYMGVEFCTRVCNFVHGCGTLYMHGIEILYMGMKICTCKWNFAYKYVLFVWAWNFVHGYKILYMGMDRGMELCTRVWNFVNGH